MSKKNDDNKDENIVADEVLEETVSEQTDETVKPSSEENRLKEDFDALQNQLKRAVADYQNLEKRVADGRTEFANWANTELIKKLLTVLDHYEKAIGGATEQERGSGWFRGVELATQQFKGVLRDEGLEEIEVDKNFDPSLHEAVDTRDGKDGEILEVVEKGYNLNGKVLKPAKVVVGRQ